MSSTDNNQIISSDKEKERRPSIMDIIKEKQNDQDFNQKLNVAITLVMELFKVLMGAFLVVFVPQKCGDGICSIEQENMIYQEIIHRRKNRNFDIHVTI